MRNRNSDGDENKRKIAVCNDSFDSKLFRHTRAPSLFLSHTDCVRIAFCQHRSLHFWFYFPVFFFRSLARCLARFKWHVIKKARSQRCKEKLKLKKFSNINPVNFSSSSVRCVSIAWKYICRLRLSYTTHTHAHTHTAHTSTVSLLAKVALHYIFHLIKIIDEGRISRNFSKKIEAEERKIPANRQCGCVGGSGSGSKQINKKNLCRHKTAVDAFPAALAALSFRSRRSLLFVQSPLHRRIRSFAPHYFLAHESDNILLFAVPFHSLAHQFKFSISLSLVGSQSRQVERTQPEGWRPFRSHRELFKLSKRISATNVRPLNREIEKTVSGRQHWRWRWHLIRLRTATSRKWKENKNYRSHSAWFVPWKTQLLSRWQSFRTAHRAVIPNLRRSWLALPCDRLSTAQRNWPCTMRPGWKWKNTRRHLRCDQISNAAICSILAAWTNRAQTRMNSTDWIHLRSPQSLVIVQMMAAEAVPVSYHLYERECGREKTGEMFLVFYFDWLTHSSILRCHRIARKFAIQMETHSSVRLKCSESMQNVMPSNDNGMNNGKQ